MNWPLNRFKGICTPWPHTLQNVDIPITMPGQLLLNKSVTADCGASGLNQHEGSPSGAYAQHLAFMELAKLCRR